VSSTHPCPFCYARELAESARLRLYYPFGFAPAIRPRHFLAPVHQQPPAGADEDVSLKNIFFGSMADVFGRWVPDEWIERTLKMCRDAPQWNFLFLTKFPKRLVGLDFPSNAWVGTSVIEQKMLPAAEAAFAEVRAGVRWLSVEPMLEPLRFTRLDLFQWVVIGGASRTAGTPEWRPHYPWVHDLVEQARAAGCAVYQKTNLAGGARLLEMPGGVPVRQDAGQRAPEVLFPRGATRPAGKPP
jgi:protein gp37